MFAAPSSKTRTKAATSPVRDAAGEHATRSWTNSRRQFDVSRNAEERLAGVPEERTGAGRWDFSKVPIFSAGGAPSIRAQQQHGSGPERGLTLGRRGDALEREADEIAGQVIRGPAARIGTTAAGMAETRGAPAAPKIVHEVVRSAGRPLDPPVRAFFENRFGRDLSSVRIHTDARAAHSARAVAARAYAVGHHLVFGAERYQPGTVDGRRLIAHELAHTLQQGSRARDETVQRDAPDGGVEAPRDAGVPLPGGVPETPSVMAVEKLSDEEIWPEFERSRANGELDRAEAIDEEMEKRASGFGTALTPRPEPVTSGSGAVTPDVALQLLENMSGGQPAFKPELGLGGCSWFTTEGNPYTGVGPEKSIKVNVEITKGEGGLVFREPDLVEIFEAESGPARAVAEAEYRAKFNIPEGAKLSNRAMKAVQRVLSRFTEKRMWTRVGEKVAASSGKVGEVILEPGSRFSDAPGKFTVVADAAKITLKGGVAPVVDALAKGGVQAEPVVVEAAEALAKRMKWVGRVRGAFHYGGRVLIVVAVAADLIRIFRAKDKFKAVVTSAGGWAGATAGGAAFAAWFAPGDAAGPWAWAVHGVGTLIAGGIGYWFGSKTTRYIYELAAE